MTLEDGKPGTFLETSFEYTNGRFEFQLKNDNKPGMEPAVWRYQHFHSHGSFMQKRALLTSCMKKVHKMASSRDTLRESALQKLAEFKRLKYPQSMLQGVCTFMGATTGEGAWIGVRSQA